MTIALTFVGKKNRTNHKYYKTDLNMKRGWIPCMVIGDVGIKGKIMEEYCVDLELAKELKENGFPQKSYFAYCGYEGILAYPEYFRWHKELGRTHAPNSDELLKELPGQICYGDFEHTALNHHALFIEKVEDYGYWHICYGDNIIAIRNKKLSNGLAEVWLLLKKEGYI